MAAFIQLIASKGEMGRGRSERRGKRKRKGAEREKESRE
jgi:hypothetical protein